MTKDKSFTKLSSHILSMLQLTKTELVNTYWQHAHEIAQTGRLAFIIRGNLAWETERVEGIFEERGLWLKSNHYDSAGKPLNQEPVRTYLQLCMNTYETWGTISAPIDPSKAGASKQSIEQALRRVALCCNAMALLFGASLQWFPARYTRVLHIPSVSPPQQMETENWACLPLAKWQEEQTCTLIRDVHIKNQLYPFMQRVESIQEPLQSAIETAIDWHAQANRYTSGLNRFLNYWVSIELLGNFWHQKSSKKMSKQVRKGEIFKKLKSVTEKDCMKMLGECAEIINPSAKAKISHLLHTIIDDEEKRAELQGGLFKRDKKSKKSLYEIRNDIAHGNFSENDLNKVQLVRHQLFEAESISGQIIRSMIDWANRTVKNDAVEGDSH